MVTVNAHGLSAQASVSVSQSSPKNRNKNIAHLFNLKDESVKGYGYIIHMNLTGEADEKCEGKTFNYKNAIWPINIKEILNSLHIRN
jgi:hypothetical protein